MDILKELYYGNIDPHEIDIRRNGEYATLAASESRNVERLTEELTDDKKKILDEILEAETEISKMTELAGFKSGFCLGVRITAAVLAEKFSEEIR